MESSLKSMVQLETILEHAHDVIFQITPQGAIQYVSPRVREVYGYASEDLIGRHLTTTTPTDELPKAFSAIESVLSGEIVKNLEINQWDAKGNLVPMEVTAVPIINDGKVVAIQGIMRDITERKKADIEFKAQYELVRRILANIPIPVLVISRNYVITFANESFLEFFNIKQKEVEGDPINEVLPIEELYNSVVVSYITKKPQNKLRFRHKIGESDRVIDVDIIPIREEDILLILHDVADVLKSDVIERNLQVHNDG